MPLICDNVYIQETNKIPALPKKCGATETEFVYLIFKDDYSGKQIAFLPENQGPFKEMTKPNVVKYLKTTGITDVVFVPLNVICDPDEPNKFGLEITRQLQNRGALNDKKVLKRMSKITQEYRDYLGDILMLWTELDPNYKKDLQQLLYKPLWLRLV